MCECVCVQFIFYGTHCLELLQNRYGMSLFHWHSYPAKKFRQLNQQYIQPKSSSSSINYLTPKRYGSSTNNISSQIVLAAQPTIYSGSSINNIFSQKVLAAKPTTSPAKKLWQLNQQYIQPKVMAAQSTIYLFLQPKIVCAIYFLWYTLFGIVPESSRSLTSEWHWEMHEGKSSGRHFLWESQTLH